MTIFALKKFKIPTFSWMDTRFIRRFHGFEFFIQIQLHIHLPSKLGQEPVFLTVAENQSIITLQIFGKVISSYIVLEELLVDLTVEDLDSLTL